jgi:hypothetical protein
MEHTERSEELQHEADGLEEQSDRLGSEIEETGSDWEAKKSDTAVPGAASEEAAGPHNIDAEDPATGERKGEEREAERDDVLREDAEQERSEAGGESSR